MKAKLIIEMPPNCLHCPLIKAWYGTERNTTHVRCHAGKCEMNGLPGNYEKSNIRPDYCPLSEESNEKM